MFTRTLAFLTLLFISTTGAQPGGAVAPGPRPARHARVLDDVEGCRVPPPSPEPVIAATCSDEGRP